ncbi:hypothetical protein NEAUS03_0021 [Nematocida ausubeli]|nr:hypothetical protein NEAUS03_0021 [Nematocida ausubeli]
MRREKTQKRAKRQASSEEETESSSKDTYSETSRLSEEEQSEYASENHTPEDVLSPGFESDKEEEQMLLNPEMDGDIEDDMIEYAHSNDGSGSIDRSNSLEKGDFGYSDDKIKREEEHTREDMSSAYTYSDQEKPDLEAEMEEQSEENGTEAGETSQSYHPKEEENSCEEDDIIECRETTLPTKTENSKKRHLEDQDAPSKVAKTESIEEAKSYPVSNEADEKMQAYLEKNTSQILDLRERGWKRNSRPLLWRPSVEAYEEEISQVNEEAILQRFRTQIENPSMFNVRKIKADPYYAKQQIRSRKNLTKSDLLRVKERMETSKIIEVQQVLRRKTRMEKDMLNKTRNLHVKLKEIGHQTEASDIFALLTQEYIFQKKDIVQSMENMLNDLSYIHNRAGENKQYLLKCIDFIEQSVVIE